MPEKACGPAFLAGGVRPKMITPPSRLLAIASAAFTTFALVASSCQFIDRLNSTPSVSRPFANYPLQLLAVHATPFADGVCFRSEGATNDRRAFTSEFEAGTMEDRKST